MSTTVSMDDRLQALEEARQKAVRRGRQWLIGGACAALAASLICVQAASPTVGVMTVTAVLGLGYVMRQRNHLEVIGRFKQQIIPVVLSEIAPSLYYVFGSGLDQSEFAACGLFAQPDRYHSRDLIEGSYGQTALRMALVHAEERYTTTHTDADGTEHTETRYRTLFRGLLLVADFNKHLKARTVVTPRTFGQLGSLFGGALTLEDPEFNRRFVATSTDPVEARFVLTPTFMQRLVGLQKRMGFRMACSRNTLYLAADTSLILFEPTLLQSFTEGGQVRQLADTLKNLIGIVDDLDLNTRIWNRPG